MLFGSVAKPACNLGLPYGRNSTYALNMRNITMASKKTKSLDNAALASQGGAVTGISLEASPLYIQSFTRQSCSITIEGTSPLIVHRWSEKAKGEIRRKQEKLAPVGRQKREAKKEFEDARYLLNGKDAFPALAFKNSMVEAAIASGLKKVDVRRAFYLASDGRLPEGPAVFLRASEPWMREDCVRVGMGSADLRYRPQYDQWEVDLKFEYDTSVCSAEILVSLLDRGGFSTGVGEWRPQRDGDNGMFRVKVIQ